MNNTWAYNLKQNVNFGTRYYLYEKCMYSTYIPKEHNMVMLSRHLTEASLAAVTRKVGGWRGGFSNPVIVACDNKILLSQLSACFKYYIRPPSKRCRGVNTCLATLQVFSVNDIVRIFIIACFKLLIRICHLYTIYLIPSVFRIVAGYFLNWFAYCPSLYTGRLTGISSVSQRRAGSKWQPREWLAWGPGIRISFVGSYRRSSK